MAEELQRIKYGTGREALIEAAVRVVARHGLHGMTFRKVAQEAGVNNSLVAHHFGSLSSLASAALSWSATTALNDSHLAGFRDSAEDYRSALWSTLSEEKDLHVYQFEMVLEASRDEEIREHIIAMYDQYTAEVSRSMFGDSANDEDRALARAVFAALDGLVLQFVSGAIDREQVDSSVDALWKLAALASASSH
ncbi:MAG: TetR family transcriptional regulator [Microbacterium sp.]|uniref:TetR/AcrR family transcriptional regulator n=1 Tax=unclassified Microbacterium TaxID=2609290 RepID=UPI001DF5DD27|nr:TetR family transcriptional regulator [Microbacterium sp.]MBW8762367.1 TetR family transcriptional regulator [Microbacterium sp.]